jgi:hypothetical protein
MDTIPLVLAALAGVIMIIGAASLMNVAMRKKHPNVVDA